MEELFALLHFLEPVKFKDPAQLAEAFTADAAKVAKRKGGGGDSGSGGESGDDSSDDEETREALAEAAATQLKNLHELLGNHMLRRLKRDVLKGLPKKRKVEAWPSVSHARQFLQLIFNSIWFSRSRSL